MNADEYLKDRLEKCSEYKLSESDKQCLAKNGLNFFIYKKVVSKKFRKWRIDSVLQEKIQRVISSSVESNKPIKLVFPFGGYKLWRLSSSPIVDWAEFFSISYYADYLNPIALAYKPGVEFIFYSMDFIVERMDNIPPSDTDAYFNSFQQLLKIFSQYFPRNIKMIVKRFSDEYKERPEKELSSLIKEQRRTFLKQDKAKIEKLLKSSELNIRMNGVKNWEELSPQEQQCKIIEGAIIHEAQHHLGKRRELLDGEDRIRLSAEKIEKAIPLGTSKTSVTKFWTGIGVLEKRGNLFAEKILSPQCIEKFKERKKEIKKINLIPLHTFKEIDIFSQ